MKKILIIEDNREYSALLAEALREAGHEVRECACGRNALQSALDLLPDLLLLDYNLGDMTGYDVARAMKSRPDTAQIPFLTLSSMGADPLIIAAFVKLPSCRGVLTKTAPLDKIVETIRKTFLQKR